MKVGLGLGLGYSRSAVATTVAWPPTVSSATFTSDYRSDMGITGTTNVTQINDQKGSNNMVPGGYPTGPALITNALGSHPTLRFGSSSTMTHPLTGGANTSVAFVAKNNNIVNGYGGLITFSGGTDIFINLPTVGNWGCTSGPTQLSSYTLSTPTACVITFGAANNVKLYTSNNTVETFTNGTAFADYAASEIGKAGANHGQFDLYHLAYYAGTLSATDAATVISSMKSLWGV